MPFEWTQLNIDTDIILVACGLGNICHPDDPDFDDNIKDVGVMMNAAYAEDFRGIIKYMVDTVKIDEPIPSKVIEWTDFTSYLEYQKAIFYYDTDNMEKLNYLLETAHRDFANELNLEPDDENIC